MYSASFPDSARDSVDLRSDTVTRPNKEMFEAMQCAPLGDDVLGDDPTVIRLEQMAAEMVGMEAAMLVPSGTMGNQVAIASHTRPGDAILVEEQAHVLYYEVGAPAVLANVVTFTLPSLRGVMDPDYLEARVLKPNLHSPGTALICVENTHNRGGGSIVPLSAMHAYREIADRHGIKVHLDGARVFNAAVALGVDVKEITSQVDSVSFCLSKGLRSPIGSLLCGPSDFIEKARIWRKRLGGGMRQAGILAACGVVSLTKNVARLADDHRRARRTAEALASLPGLSVDLEGVQTNMVLVTTDKPAAEWQSSLDALGVHCFPVAANRLRLVFHADVDDAKTDRAIAAFKKLTGS